MTNFWSEGAHLKVRYEGDRGYIQNVKEDTVPPILIASPEGKVRPHLLQQEERLQRFIKHNISLNMIAIATFYSTNLIPSRTIWFALGLQSLGAKSVMKKN